MPETRQALTDTSGFTTTTLGEVTKDATTKVVFDLTNKGNSRFISIRTFVCTEEGWIPTRKGVTIPEKSWNQLMPILGILVLRLQ
jgi:transposase-like protein